MNNGIGVAKFLTVPISSAKRGNVALYEHFEHKVTDMYEDIMTVLLCGRGDRWCQGGGGITSGPYIITSLHYSPFLFSI